MINISSKIKEIDEGINKLYNKKRGLTQFINNPKKLNSILELKIRTRILNRMINDPNLKFGCSRCGWNDSVGDLHHIYGRNIKDADINKNISYLCPNCHRLVHNGLINKNELISFEEQKGGKWKDYMNMEELSENKYKKRIQDINKRILLLKKKREKYKKELNILQKLRESNIDFSKLGWVNKASKIIGVSPQKTRKWIKIRDPKLLEESYIRSKPKLSK